MTKNRAVLIAVVVGAVIPIWLVALPQPLDNHSPAFIALLVYAIVSLPVLMRLRAAIRQSRE
jgi:hypothetical protein